MTFSLFRRVQRSLFMAKAGCAVFAFLACASPNQAEEAHAKAPYHLLYSNDTTNIETCVSPYRKGGEAFRPEMLEASVDEAADADVQLLQPGLTWVPLWQSSVLPPAEHFRWWQENFPGPISSIGDYVSKGGDTVRVFVDRCRARKVAPFISLRINDYHGLEMIDAKPGTKISPFFSLTLDRFRREHPQYRLSYGKTLPEKATVPKIRDLSVMNWAFPEVRERIMLMAREICTNYDIDGLELDFMRHYRLFNEQTPLAERERIVTDFVSQVRALLDRTTKPGRHRWLCVRIPALVKGHAPLGINVAAMEKAGVEMFNLSVTYFTIQQDLDVAAIRKLAPNSAIYLEMTHCVDMYGASPDTDFYGRTTDEQFLATADLALKQGADGMSLFNFAYFREYGGKKRGPFNEPPFYLLPLLKDPAALAAGPHDYFLSTKWRSPFGNKLQLPRHVAPGETTTFTLALTAPPKGWKNTGKLRIQANDASAECTASLNGKALSPNADVSSLFHNTHPYPFDPAKTRKCWTIDPSALQEGGNTVEFRVSGAKPLDISFLEMELP
jgi:hypothetical protein